MDTLRVLLVDNDVNESERIAGRLEQAHHAVLPAGGLEEAAQALEIQRFDAVIVSSKLVSEELRTFRQKLNSAASNGRVPTQVPFLCYSPASGEQPTAEVLERCEVDACLPDDFEATFSQFIARLAAELYASQAANTVGDKPALATFKADEFQAQLDFDRDLIVEILDLFLADSARQLTEMRTAAETGNWLNLSRLAHSIKGSLGSLYAMEAASRAQVLEQVAKAGDGAHSIAALKALETAMEALLPEVLRLRRAES